MDDDEDMRGQGTLVMRPEQSGAMRDDPTDQVDLPGDPATLLKNVPPPQMGTMQMPPVSVDPFARTDLPRSPEFTPSGTKPLGIMPPSELAHGLPNLAPVQQAPTQQAPMVTPGAMFPRAPFPSQPSSPSNPMAPPAPTSNPGFPGNPALTSHPGLTSSPDFPRPIDLGGPLVRDEPPRKKSVLPVVLGALIGVLLIVAIVLVVILVRSPPPTTAGSSSAVASTSSTAVSGPADTLSTTPNATTTTAATGNATSATSATAAPAVAKSEPEAAAIAALEKLRDSIAACVKGHIHNLPGTSPAVPSTMRALKSGPYKPLLTDWVSPFFSCTNFKLDGPMPFMIQWQFQRPDKAGTGIAWIDANGDGTPEKAFAFTGTLKDKNVVEFTPIVAADPKRKPQKPR